MRMLKSILLATDLLPASQEAANAAIQLAAAFDARVSVLHVIEPMPHWPVAMHEHKEQATGILRELTDKLSANKVAIGDAHIVSGPPADTIVKKAMEMDADLILIGAGERSPFGRFSIGPVATAIFEQAPQPVLAVRPGEPALRFKTILCPVDSSGASQRGLANAIRLARTLQSNLVILTVVPEVSWITAAVETGQLAGAKSEYEKTWREEFDKFLLKFDTKGVQVKTDVRQGKPHDQISAAAKDHQADIVIMGATGRTGLVRVLLGSTTRRLLEQLPCSLLTVKEEDVVEVLLEGEVRLMKQLMNEGQALIAASSDEAAIVKFRQVLAHNPFHIGATEALAAAHEKLGRHELAAFYHARAGKLREKP